MITVALFAAVLQASLVRIPFSLAIVPAMHEHVHAHAREQDQVGQEFVQVLSMLHQQEVCGGTDEDECCQTLGCQPE